MNEGTYNQCCDKVLEKRGAEGGPAASPGAASPGAAATDDVEAPPCTTTGGLDSVDDMEIAGELDVVGCACRGREGGGEPGTNFRTSGDDGSASSSHRNASWRRSPGVGHSIKVPLLALPPEIGHKSLRTNHRGCRMNELRNH